MNIFVVLQTRFGFFKSVQREEEEEVLFFDMETGGVRANCAAGKQQHDCPSGEALSWLSEPRPSSVSLCVSGAASHPAGLLTPSIRLCFSLEPRRRHKNQ